MIDYPTLCRRLNLLCYLTLITMLCGTSVHAEEEITGSELESEDAEVVQRNVYPLPPEDIDVVGELKLVTAKAEDTLLDIGRRHGIGFEAMRMANPGVDLWMPAEGTEVVIPSRFVLPPGPREGLVINLPEMRLYYYPEPKPGEQRVVETYAVSIGRLDWSTPIGITKVTNRLEKPAWFPPASVRAAHAEEGGFLPRRVDPGPDNPLGDYAIGLDIAGYYIHGTNRPYGVGMRASAGCIRMFPEDIASLVYRLPVGTEVRIMNEPYKAGWHAGQLYIQAHPVLEEHEDQDVATYANAVRAVAAKLESRPGRINYEHLKAAVNVRNGLPVSISRNAVEGIGLAKSDK
ncbi:MAG: L,D-transpeptidase family protein [Aquisalimonadaceae bacterium]